MTREKYLKYYGRAGCGDGYACLTGKNEQITRLADAVGFHYRYVPKTGEYAHTAVTMICTPDGRLSRYLYGVEYDPQTLRLSLLEASQGKIGTPMEQLFLYCFQYDSASGRYGPSAFKLMRLGGILTVVVLGALLLVYWRRESVKIAKERTGGSTMIDAFSVTHSASAALLGQGSFWLPPPTVRRRRPWTTCFT